MKEKKGKDKKKKVKKGKKEGDEDGAGPKMLKIGPSEIVKKFDMFYAEYNASWANRDESLNPDQGYDKVMLRNEVMP